MRLDAGETRQTAREGGGENIGLIIMQSARLGNRAISVRVCVRVSE